MRSGRKLVAFVPLFAILAGCQQPAQEAPAAPPKEAAPAPAAVAPAERGRYLVSIAACHDCHTPKNMTPEGPVDDQARILSGHRADEKLPPVPANVIGPGKWGALSNNSFTAWVGPWGVSFTQNLTPDVATGLGSWTEEMFVNAIRTGKHQGTGRAILPPMPWPVYRNMTDEDLKAVFAYLKTIPPINNAVPEPVPPEKLPK